MPFIPHTEQDVAHMLDALDIKASEQLYDEVPTSIPKADLSQVPLGLNEVDMTRLMQQREPKNDSHLSFIGAGSYQHHIPSIVWQLTARGEFYTAYTPYQAEASQGSLQIIYEYQTMMANLMGMDVSNASLYDGASALAEAVLMAVRIKRSKAKRILVPRGLHPRYRRVLQSMLHHQGIELIDVALDSDSATITLDALEAAASDNTAAVIISQPNFLGAIDDVDTLCDWAHSKKLLCIAVVNPIAMSLLKPPGEWGEHGADIVCGEGQPLGIPMAGGGPYFGFMCCNKANIRQIPGRIVGRTVDENGQTGYTLTLQAREQHIRRAKATSNICTNQGLAVTAATIYMSVMGFAGLSDVAKACHHRSQQLKQRLNNIPGVSLTHNSNNFHELAFSVEGFSAKQILDHLLSKGIQGGFDLSQDYPEFGQSVLACCTELHNDADLDAYAQAIASLGA